MFFFLTKKEKKLINVNKQWLFQANVLSRTTVHTLKDKWVYNEVQSDY